jgi:hypothetical protein
MTYAPEYGRAVRVREFERPMLSDDVETAQTVAYMEELACFDAGERHVIDATHRALAEAGCDLDSATHEIANAIFSFLKRTIRYVPTPATSALVDQTLIAPSALLQMPDPEGDCPQFSMLAASMFRRCCIPCFFVTIAADPKYPTIFSHVYNAVEVAPGRLLPFDASNGPELGAEYLLAMKKRVWPRTNPDLCTRKGNVTMLRSGRPARGFRNTGLRGLSGNGDYGGETNNPANPYDIGYMESMDGRGSGGSGTPWASIFTTLANDATKVFQSVNAPSRPYYVTNPSGQQVLFNPATGSTVSASGGVSISSNTALLIGAAILATVVLSRK